MINVASTRGRNHVIPEAARNYRLHMGGVDVRDMWLYQFLDEQKTVEWTKKVFLCLLGRALLNADIIYQKKCTDEQVRISVVDAQKSMCIRHVDDTFSVHEEFVDSATETTGASRSNMLQYSLIRLNLPIMHLRAQTYDGAS